MIICRSPLRVSLGGGGTDLPSYYQEHGGFVIAAAIDKYVYITLHETFQREYLIKYSLTEAVQKIEDIKHPLIREALKLIPDAPEELAATLQSVTSPAAVAYVVSNFLDIKIEEKQQILEINDVQERLDRVLWFLAHRLEVLRLSHDIGKRTRETMEGRQREFLLREQLKTIQKELGEGDDAGQETASLAKAIAKANMPAEVEKHARKEKKVAELTGVPWEAQLMLVADQTTPYRLLTEVLYSCGQAGFQNYRLLVLKSKD